MKKAILLGILAALSEIAVVYDALMLRDITWLHAEKQAKKRAEKKAKKAENPA